MAKRHVEARVRFNWGFHDAQADADTNQRERDMSTHFDGAYARGYVAGFDQYRREKSLDETSDAAWAQSALSA